jgi:hypothetical protein
MVGADHDRPTVDTNVRRGRGCREASPAIGRETL